MPGRLSSPRFRRRLVKVSLLGAVLGAGALVSVLFWNTASIVETPLHGTANLYAPPIPEPLAAAERRRVIATAARFVNTAVKREHPERAFELVGPSLRNGTTKADWREGDIPVVPYPVHDARWRFDYSHADEIGLQVAVFPAAGAAVRPMVFDMSLRADRVGAERRWLVDSWSPRGGGGGRPARSEGSPFPVAVHGVPDRASTSLGIVWLLVPVGVIGLALLLPATLVVVERIRTRRAQRAHDASF